MLVASSHSWAMKAPTIRPCNVARRHCEGSHRCKGDRAPQARLVRERDDALEEIVPTSRGPGRVPQIKAMPVEQDRGQVGGPTVQAELVPVHHTADRRSLDQDVR